MLLVSQMTSSSRPAAYTARKAIATDCAMGPGGGRGGGPTGTLAAVRGGSTTAALTGSLPSALGELGSRFAARGRRGRRPALGPAHQHLERHGVRPQHDARVASDHLAD